MGLKDSLKQDLTEAMRARDELLLSTIRLCLSAITNEEVSGKEARVLTEPEVIQVLSREAKKRRESAQAFTDANRPDRAERENAEGEVIARYLPTPLSEAELASLIAEAIKESGAAGPAVAGAAAHAAVAADAPCDRR